MLLNVLNKSSSIQHSIRLLRVSCRNMCDMARVFVRSVEHEDRLQITFKYQPDNQSKQHIYNFDRLKTEGLERTISHIATRITNVVKKRLKRNKLACDDVTPAEVRVLGEDGCVVCSSEPNVSAWTDGRCMQIEDQLFHVCVNVPTVRKLSLPQRIMVGFPVYASVNLEFADVSDCEFTWYRLSNIEASASSQEFGNVSAQDQELNVSKKYKKTKQNDKIAIKVFVGRSYVPTADDVGCQLQLECVPVKAEVTGETVSMVSPAAVQNAPSVSFPFEKRHKLTEQMTSGDRLVLITLIMSLSLIYHYHPITVLFLYCIRSICVLLHGKWLKCKNMFSDGHTLWHT